MKYLMQWRGNARVPAASRVGVQMCTRKTVMFCKILCCRVTPERISTDPEDGKQTALRFTAHLICESREHISSLPSKRFVFRDEHRGQKKRGKTTDVNPEWRVLTSPTLVSNMQSTRVRSLHLTWRLHWSGWWNKWWCSTLLPVHNWVMFAQLPEHRALAHGWFFLREAEQVVCSQWRALARLWCHHDHIYKHMKPTDQVLYQRSLRL